MIKIPEIKIDIAVPYKPSLSEEVAEIITKKIYNHFDRSKIDKELEYQVVTTLNEVQIILLNQGILKNGTCYDNEFISSMDFCHLLKKAKEDNNRLLTRNEILSERLDNLKRKMKDFLNDC